MRILIEFLCMICSMEDLSFIPDLPSGPLDVYRKKASFDWKRLKLAMEGDIDLLRLKVSLSHAHRPCMRHVTGTEFRHAF